MTDGLNHSRAVRLTEIMQDFRTLQHYITQIRVNPPLPEDYYLEGHVLLRDSITESQAVLRVPFETTDSAPEGNPEAEKTQLQRVLLDAATRRFQVHRIYLRAGAALRWLNARNAITQDTQYTGVARSQALANIDQGLSSELATITDERVADHIRAIDIQAGKWTPEDPSLQQIQHWISVITARQSPTSPLSSVSSRSAGSRR